MDPLTAFGARLCGLLAEAGIVPILYGSYLLRELVDEPIEVHDIDLYVREADYTEITRLFRGAGISFEHHPKDHTLIARDGDRVVEFDEREHYYDGPEDFVPFELGGVPILALTRDGLRHVYATAARVSDQPEKYAGKVELLAEDR